MVPAGHVTESQPIIPSSPSFGSGWRSSKGCSKACGRPSRATVRHSRRRLWITNVDDTSRAGRDRGKTGPCAPHSRINSRRATRTRLAEHTAPGDSRKERTARDCRQLFAGLFALRVHAVPQAVHPVLQAYDCPALLAALGRDCDEDRHAHADHCPGGRVHCFDFPLVLGAGSTGPVRRGAPCRLHLYFLMLSGGRGFRAHRVAGLRRP